MESAPPRRFVTRIADKSLRFGGTWTYDLQSTPAGTRVTIREDGEAYNPVFRVVSRCVMGPDATTKKYLGALEASMAAP